MVLISPKGMPASALNRLGRPGSALRTFSFYFTRVVAKLLLVIGLMT